MKFIKVVILFLVLSTNLMLGQKKDAPIIKNRCQENPIDLRILQTTPNFAQPIIENCQEIPQSDLLETSAFFRFAAF